MTSLLGSRPLPDKPRDQLLNACALGNIIFTSGVKYWEVEADTTTMKQDNMKVLFSIGVCTKKNAGQGHPGRDARSWAVDVSMQDAGIAVEMIHENKRLLQLPSVMAKDGGRCCFGFLLNFDKRTLVVINVSSKKSIFKFSNIDTKDGLIPLFAVYWPGIHKGIIRVISGPSISQPLTLLSILNYA